MKTTNKTCAEMVRLY